MMGLQYRVVYKKGIPMGKRFLSHASRSIAHNSLLCQLFSLSGLSESLPVTVITNMYSVVLKLAVDGFSEPHYTLHDGILHYDNII